MLRLCFLPLAQMNESVPIDRSWSKSLQLLQGRPRTQAALVAAGWNLAAQSGSSALLLDLLANHNGPHGICQALDWAGMPTPDRIEVFNNSGGW